MPRKSKREETPSPNGTSAWPYLFNHKEIAGRIVDQKIWLPFAKDLVAHRTVNLERLAQTDDEKTADKLRGAIKAIDFILSLPEAVENWKKQ